MCDKRDYPIMFVSFRVSIKWSSPDRLRHGKMRVRQATFRDNFYLVLRPTKTICCVHGLLHARERDACIDCDDSVLPQQKREVDTS